MKLDQLDALGQAELIKKKELSPKELLEFTYERIDRLNPSLNAVIWTDRERALAHAESGPPGSDPDKPFYGVPFLLKDLMAQDAGQPCSYSSKNLKDWRPDQDAELVRRYKEAGFVIAGRTNTPEFGIYAVTEPALRGPARNPWDLNHTPGGSSGGSAAAVAARLVPAAHAGDGGGSIRIPAAHCGLVGMKPSRARNPLGPFAAERWGAMVVEHAVTRSVRDSAAILDATQGPDLGAPYQILPPERPYLEEAALGAQGKGRRLKIALTDAPLFGQETDPECIAAVKDAAKLAESLGHEVVYARPDFEKEALIQAYFTLVAAGTNNSVQMAAAHAGRAPRASDFEAPTWLLKLIADKITAAEYVATLDLIHKTGRQIAHFFEDYDVFLTPTAAKPPVPVGSFKPSALERALMASLSAVPSRSLLMRAKDTLATNALNATPNTMLFNMTGQPAISLPLSWSEAGLPIGTQWVGRFGDEATLFQLAAELEVARPWADKRPPVS